jgi:hypothetical protein
MPALVPVVNLYFDTTAYGVPGEQLLQSLTSSGTLDALGLVAEDQLTLNIWPRVTNTAIGAATTTQQLSNANGLIFTGKQTGALSSSMLLIYASGFTEQQDGNGNYYYTTSLLLNKTQLIAAFGSSDYLPITLELQNVGLTFGMQRFQFACNIYPSVYLGTEGLPTSALPGYWNQQQSDARYLRGDSGLTGKRALAAGVSSAQVTGLTLPFTPDTVLAWVNQAGGAATPIFGDVDESTITPAGFTVNFGGLPPDAVHILRWLCLPAPGAYTNGNPSVPPTAQNLAVTTAAATVPLQIPGLISLDLTSATGNVTLTLTNPVTGGLYTFEVLQGATPRTITFPAGTKQKGGGGGTYLPSGANLTDFIHLTFDGTNYLISVEGNYA